MPTSRSKLRLALPTFVRRERSTFASYRRREEGGYRNHSLHLLRRVDATALPPVSPPLLLRLPGGDQETSLASEAVLASDLLALRNS